MICRICAAAVITVLPVQRKVQSVIWLAKSAYVIRVQQESRCTFNELLLPREDKR
jgi:hypothetical protein